MYKRVLLKLSGEALSSAEYAFDPMLLSRLADELKEVHHLGIDLAIVVGGRYKKRGHPAHPRQDDGTDGR